MKTSPEVERWFGEKKLPAEATIRQVREIILLADRRMTEFVKYGTRIPGKVSHLEASGPSARFMRFADPAEAQARAAELSNIVVAWCSLTPMERGGPTKPTMKVGASGSKSG
jgi:hypothetical protein